MNDFCLTPENILFGEKLKKEVLKCEPQKFIDAVVESAKKLDVYAEQLMAVMELETGGTFDPSITNALGYTGLIQFGNAAANDVGKTRLQLRQMTACEQMKYVCKFLMRYAGEYRTLSDLYFAVFFPKAVGKPDDWVLQARNLSASKIARNNPLFDANQDQKITVKEVKKQLAKRVPKKWDWIL